MEISASNLMVFDWETSGRLPEYALQSWRIPRGDAWGTSLVWLDNAQGKPKISGGILASDDLPQAEVLVRCRSAAKEMLVEALDRKMVMGGWNTPFDVSILIALGLEDLVGKIMFVDGVLLWRHFFIEPESEVDRSKKKSYGLKAFIAETFPDKKGYEDDADFHDASPEARQKLHKYNVRDCLGTYAGIRMLWDRLTPAQRTAAIIEARSIPLVASANFCGLPVDQLATRELQQTLRDTAAECLKELSPHGVSEQIVRSPLKMAALLFDQWGLPVLKENVGKKTKKVSRATDKEVLHELAFIDPRARTLHKYREALGNCKKFADNILDSANYNADNRVHPQAIIFGTYTSRMTYASKQGKNKDERPIGFAIHQEKGKAEGKFYRAAIAAPPGYDMLEFDADGQEYRWMAILSGDEDMLHLCMPGEDAHSFMAANLNEGVSYRALMKLVEEEDKVAEMIRKSGKFANLCVAEGSTVLTDRGPCSVEQVRIDDRVWDGVEFVSHDGVSFSGVRGVLTYQGITATPEHCVLVAGRWVQIDKAQRMGWAIDRACQARSTVRIVGGLARRAVREVGGYLRTGALRLWAGARSQSQVHGDWPVSTVQGLRVAPTPSAHRKPDRQERRGQATTEACQRVVPTLRQSQRQVLSQLRWTWDQVLLLVGVGGGSVHQGGATAPNVPQAGHRPEGQRWSLRAWKLALGYAQGEPRQQTEVRTYDIVNCGPRARFAVNGLIVHNSCQYRTGPKKLRVKARVEYDIPMELPEATRIWSMYPRIYKKVPIYWRNQILKTKKLGYVETLAGRRVRVQGNWDGPMGWSMESTSINYPIQGTGGEQKYLALAVLQGYLTEIGAYFAFDLHDGLYFFCPKAKTAEALPKMKHLLDNLPYDKAWGFKSPIPLTWGAKVGGSWGALKNWKG